MSAADGTSSPLTFLGIDPRTGIIFLSPSAEHQIGDIAEMPAVTVGQTVTVIDHLPEAFAWQRAAAPRSVAAIASFEAAEFDVVVLAGEGNSFGVALANNGSTLGLVANVSGRQVIFDQADLSVLRRQAMTAWGSTTSASSG